MKETKKAEIRRNEIMDVAEKLFITKGYLNTTINDVLKSTGIAKGLLYYYFTSKEEILDGIIKRHGDSLIEMATEIVNSAELSAQEKLLKVLLSQKPKDSLEKQLIEDLENSSDGYMFLKSLTDIVLRLGPIVGEVITQGVKSGEFSTPFPSESADILLAAAHTLFDNANFNWTEKEQVERVKAFLFSIERVLGTKEGSLLKLAVLFE